MCAVAAIPLAIMAVGALSSANAGKQASQNTKIAYEYNSAVERNKAHVLELQADDAVQRGQTQQTRQQLKTAQLKGAQRARFAAAGMDLKEGSAFNVLMDTDYMGKQDEMTIADNAEREAWSLRESARTGINNADFLALRARSEHPDQAYSNSLLGSAGSVASSWYGKKGA